MTAFILFIARLMIGGAFLYSGVSHFFKLDAIAAMMVRRGVPYPRETLIVGSLFQSLCGLLVIVGWWVNAALVGLIIFTIAASWMFHNFWDMQPPERGMQITAITKNVVSVGAMLALVVLI